jgi:hypothetical protein
LFPAIKHTDGIQFVGASGASWLVTDILVILSMEPKVKGQDFVTITADRDPDGAIIVQYTDGNGNELFRQKYVYSDLPCAVSMYYTDSVLLLTSEY